MADSLSPDEGKLISDLQARLAGHVARNREALQYYESDHKPSHYGISVPPQMQNLKIHIGWSAKVCDVNNARLDFEGWASPTDANPFGLQDIYADNDVRVLAHQAHLDALIFGTSFVVVGTGAEGEPDPLITVHSPLAMTANYSLRTRRLTSALSYYEDPQNNEVTATLYLPDQTITLAAEKSAPFQVVGRDVHKLGRVPVVLLANRARSNRPFGRSEITKSIRSSQDGGVRASINMAVNSEFFAAPQRYALGASEESFLNADGTPKGQWQLIQGRLLALSGESDEQNPAVGQFPQASPTPYIDVINQLARQVASDADLPVRYFDENRNAPTSADAIRADESALVARAERKQVEFSPAWRQVAELALLVRDRSVPDEFRNVRPLWASPATPTRAASTDAALKLVQSGIAPKDSDVILEMLDMSEFDRERVRVAAAKATVAASDEANSLKAKFDALGVAIRSGVSPESAAALLGLGDIKFTGAMPVTLRLPEAEAAGLEDVNGGA